MSQLEFAATNAVAAHPARLSRVSAGAMLLGLAFAGSASATDLGGIIPPGTTVTLGAQAIVQPKYEGGKDYEVTGAPIIKFSGANPFSSFLKVDARNINDIGLGLLNVGGFSAGPALGYRFDREEDDGRLLRGLGDIDGGFLVGGFARYDFNPAYVRVSYLTQVSGEEDAGGILRIQGGADMVAAPQLVLRGFAAVEFGDDDYMQTYFGVTAAQAARSGLTRFTPEAGAKSFHLGLTAEYEFAPTWTLIAGAEYVGLLDDAADSPVVEEENYVIGRIGLSKRFTIGR
jgi:outer membrane scaffolding protein for murein synthesis (MipA/OmpV family)